MAGVLWGRGRGGGCLLFYKSAPCWGQGCEPGPQRAPHASLLRTCMAVRPAVPPGAEGGAHRDPTGGCESAPGASRGRRACVGWASQGFPGAILSHRGAVTSARCNGRGFPFGGYRGNGAGFHEKVVPAPRSRTPGAKALAPSERGPRAGAGLPRSLLSLCYPAKGDQGNAFLECPGLFLQVGKGGDHPAVSFFAFKRWLLFPLTLCHLCLGAEQDSSHGPGQRWAPRAGLGQGWRLQAGEPRARLSAP